MTDEIPHSDKTAARPPPLPGEAGAVRESIDVDRYTNPQADFEGHELHATGGTCALCQQLILQGQDVRRHLDGTYTHEECP